MRAALLGFLGGLAALLLVGMVAGVAFWRYQAASPERERAALVADLDAYAAWYEREQWRGNLELPSFERDRNNFIAQRPTLRQYVLWWQAERRAMPNGGSVYNIVLTDTLRPADLRDDALISRYINR